MDFIISSCQYHKDAGIFFRVIRIEAYGLFRLHETHSRAIYAAPALCMRDADIRSDNDVGPKLFDFLDNDFRIFLFDGTISQKWRTSCPDGVPPVSKTFMERIVLSLDKFFKYGSPLSSLQAGTERNAMRTK